MTWAEFNTEVRAHLPQHSRRQGIQDLIDKLIVAAARDLQRFVRGFQTGHVDTYDVDAVTAYGYASSVSAPAGTVSRVWQVVYDADTEEEDPCDFCDMQLVPPLVLQDMRCGTVGEKDALAVIDRGTIYVVPAITESSHLKVQWDGVKTDFADEDETKFDDDAVTAAADFVLARLARQVDGDLAAAASYDMTYRRARNALFSEYRARNRVATPETIP